MRQFTTPTSSVLYFLHSDHLGSTSLTTDASGNPVARQLYDAWGNVRYVTGTLPTDIGYTGQRLDSTGLMYYRARYYARAWAASSAQIRLCREREIRNSLIDMHTP